MRGKVGCATSTFSVHPYRLNISSMPYMEKIECGKCKRKGHPLIIGHNHKCSHRNKCGNCGLCAADNITWPTCKGCQKTIYVGKLRDYCYYECKQAHLFPHKLSNAPKPIRDYKIERINRAPRKYKCYTCKKNFMQVLDERYCSKKCRYKKAKINFERYGQLLVKIKCKHKQKSKS